MVPWDTPANIEAATRYKELTNTIQGNGLSVFTSHLRNKNILTELCHSLRITKVNGVVRNCGKLAVLGSFSIWNARYSSDWNGGAVLKP